MAIMQMPARTRVPLRELVFRSPKEHAGTCRNACSFAACAGMLFWKSLVQSTWMPMGNSYACEYWFALWKCRVWNTGSINSGRERASRMEGRVGYLDVINIT